MAAPLRRPRVPDARRRRERAPRRAPRPRGRRPERPRRSARLRAEPGCDPRRRLPRPVRQPRGLAAPRGRPFDPPRGGRAPAGAGVGPRDAGPLPRAPLPLLRLHAPRLRGGGPPGRGPSSWRRRSRSSASSSCRGSRGAPRGSCATCSRYAGIPRPYGLTTVLPRGVAAVLFVAVLAALPALARGTAPDGPRARDGARGRRSHDLHPGNGRGVLRDSGDLGRCLRVPGYWLFSGVAYVFLLTGPNNLQAIPIPPPWNAVWLSLVVWGVLLVREARRSYGAVDPGAAAGEERRSLGAKTSARP